MDVKTQKNQQTHQTDPLNTQVTAWIYLLSWNGWEGVKNEWIEHGLMENWKTKDSRMKEVATRKDITLNR